MYGRFARKVRCYNACLSLSLSLFEESLICIFSNEDDLTVKLMEIISYNNIVREIINKGQPILQVVVRIVYHSLCISIIA